MTTAECACGALKLDVRAEPQLTALCHCLSCQKRTGSVFSANAFYSVESVEIRGSASEFVRTGDSGRTVRLYFCPSCGSTVYWRAEATPHWIGVAVGAFGDPAFRSPTLSVFEQSKHTWLQRDSSIEHFQGLPVEPE